MLYFTCLVANSDSSLSCWRPYLRLITGEICSTCVTSILQFFQELIREVTFQRLATCDRLESSRWTGFLFKVAMRLNQFCNFPCLPIIVSFSSELGYCVRLKVVAKLFTPLTIVPLFFMLFFWCFPISIIRMALRRVNYFRLSSSTCKSVLVI